MIHVVGDSHVCFFNGSDGITDMYPYAHSNPPFKTYRLGALLAYNLEEYNIGSFISNLPKTDSILFSFGEIDCRYHIKNQSIKQSVSVETIIANCVDRYIAAITKLNSNHKVGVWGPPATTLLEEKDSNSQCPIKGDHLERNRITRLFNIYLKSKALEVGVAFFSIFDDLLAEDGSTNPFYYADSIHLAQTAAPLVMKLVLWSPTDDTP
jgi:hypothetical protein